MRYFISILLTFGLTTYSLSAQNPYGNCWVNEVFTEVEVTEDITYGINATIMTMPIIGEATPVELKMDIYTPVGDDNNDRPLALVVHSGGFLPNVINSHIIGTRKDSSVVEFCTRLAKHGYTAAAIDYRKGWNPIANPSEARLGLIQAIYRGIQDGRTAIRYLRKTHAENDNPYGVNPDKIMVIGLGSAGFISTGMATLDDYEKILTTTHGPEKFFLDLNQDGVLETPMIIPAYNGDIEGKELAIAPDDSFGFPAGDTTNYPNHVEYSSEFNLCVNVGGAIPDISWVDENSVPIISFQSIWGTHFMFDMGMAYEDEMMYTHPGTIILRVQGSLEIAKKQEEIGSNGGWKDFDFNDAYTSTAMKNSMNAGHQYYEGLYPVTNPVNSFEIDEGMVIDWWDPNALSPPTDEYPDGLPWNELPFPVSGNFHEYNLMWNENMSAEKARTNIDTIFAYTLPRACLELMSVSNTKIQAADVDLVVAPNPANETCLISTDIAHPMRSALLFDMHGRLLRSFDKLNTNELSIQREGLNDGMYFLRLRFKGGIHTQKIIFNR